MPLVRCHFDSELEMNWSMTTCATLAKSPNCASQTTSWRGSARLMPNSKPSTPYSDSMLSRIMNRACPWRMWSSGTYRVPLSTSCSTAWRLLNVPRLARHEVARIRLGGVHQLAEVGDPALHLVGGDGALRHEALAVLRQHGRVRGDRLVHQGLGEGRVVELVVPVAAVANQVDDRVLLEPLAEADGQPRRLHGGLRVIAVHVEDGGLDDLGDVARIACEA